MNFNSDHLIFVYLNVSRKLLFLFVVKFCEVLKNQVL